MIKNLSQITVYKGVEFFEKFADLIAIAMAKVPDYNKYHIYEKERYFEKWQRK